MGRDLRIGAILGAALDAGQSSGESDACGGQRRPAKGWTQRGIEGSFRYVKPRRGRASLRKRFDLKKSLFVLPNLITLGAVFCGFNAIRIIAKDQATDDDFYRASVLLMFAMVFDILDGRVARMTKTQSAFGLQIDSLADIVSFGVAPALLVYKWVLHRYHPAGLFVAFLFTASAAIRLARFNVITSTPTGAPAKASRYMVGLPTPVAAGILVSLVVANQGMGGALGNERYTLTLFGVTLALSALMVSTVKFRSFKDMRLNAETILLVLFVIGSSMLIAQQYTSKFVLAWLATVYVVIGLAETLRVIAGERRERATARDSVPPAL